MEWEVDERDAAADLVTEYADEKCVGELGEIQSVEQEESCWIVEFRTHTFSDEYDHRIRVSPVGSVYSHERLDRF